jgi:hypothetical protein
MKSECGPALTLTLSLLNISANPKEQRLAGFCFKEGDACLPADR